jgi:sortase B
MEENVSRKKENRGLPRWLWWLCLVLCVGVFGFSAYQLYDYWHEAQLRESYTQDLTAAVVTVVPEEKEEAESAQTVEKPEEELLPEMEKKPPQTPIMVNFELLQQQSADVVGWLYSADTLINYPVAQAENNDYYLRRLLDGSYNYGGTLFMDYRCDPAIGDWCTTIYGHSMQDDTMFGSLLDYKKQSYYDEHPVLWYFTPGQAYKVELIGGYLTNAYSEVYEAPETAEQRDALAARVKNNSTFVSNVTWEADTRLLMLSTCSYETEDSRYVLLGKLVPVTEE